MTTPEDWTWLARIRRPQGRKGEVFADLLTDFPEKFAQRRQLWLLPEPAAAKSAKPATNAAPREVELIAHWLHKGGIVLHFAGIDSISAAETLKGLIVAIPRAERAALAEDEVYIGDLIGCTLVDVAPTTSSRPSVQSKTWTGHPGRLRCWWCAAHQAKSSSPSPKATCATSTSKPSA